MTTPRTLNARSKAAHPVAAAIHDVETSFNTAFVNIGTLLIRIAEARMDRDARMPLTVGVAATERAVELATTTALAYRQSLAVHSDLSADKVKLGLDTVGFGDFFPTIAPDGSEPVEQTERHLRAIA